MHWRMRLKIERLTNQNKKNKNSLFFLLVKFQFLIFNLNIHYQKSCIMKYTISDRLKFLFSLFPIPFIEPRLAHSFHHVASKIVRVVLGCGV